MTATLSRRTLLGSALLCQAPQRPPYPPPPPPKDPARLGAGIQRTMTLLATSTAQRRHPVRILFYGQSITKQEWWQAVADDLRRRFPHAGLTIENRAIGGYSSPYLVRTLPHDVYPLYPDLVILHVYGAEREYEEIIAGIRRHTTAEIAIQSDHVTWLPEEGAPGKAEQLERKAWHDRHSFEWLPRIAARYGCELIDVRGPWEQYLRENRLRPRDLLGDGEHLNDHGNFLMAELTKRHLRYDPSFPDARWKKLTRSYAVGHDVHWKSGRLTLEFDGNRVDAIAAPGPPGRARLLIDAKLPAELPELYAATRPSDTWCADWPAVNRIAWKTPPLIEDWTLRVVEADEAVTSFRFEVTGSLTGPDGSGTNRERFVSRSGRVVIEPSDWAMKRAYDLRKAPMPRGFEVRWQVRPTFAAAYEPPDTWNPAAEYAVTLAQGLSNALHKLELIALGGDVPYLRELRVYRPPVR